MERRSYLRALGGAGALALAGCVDELGNGTDAPATDEATPTDSPTDEATPGDGTTSTPDDGSTPAPDDESTPADESTSTPDDSAAGDDSTPADDASQGDDSADDSTADGSVDGDASRTLSIYDYPGNEPARYEFTVTGELEQTNAYGATVDDHDVVDGSTATGHVWGMMDSYRFTGEITSFEVSRQVKVVVDGDEVDPDDIGAVTGYDLGAATTEE